MAKPKASLAAALAQAAILVGILVLVHFATNARADENSQVALALGSTIAGEKPCGLDYDQAAIQRYIAKNVSERDMQFSSMLNLMVLGTTSQINSMTTSARTAFCAQIERVARSYGFTR
jgi:hypothetical protein